MHINRCCFTHNTLNRHKIFVHPIKIFLLIPNIPVHFFLKCFQLIKIKFFLSLVHRFCNFRIAAYRNLFRIISSTSKRRINIHKVYLYSLLFQISTCRHTFPANHHVAATAFANCLFLFHLIKRHSSL